MRSLFPTNSASDCLRFTKPQFCDSCGATYKRIGEMFSALLVACLVNCMVYIRFECPSAVVLGVFQLTVSLTIIPRGSLRV